MWSKNKQNNQAKDVFCHVYAVNQWSFMTCDHGHTHLIVFAHACGYYFFCRAPCVTTIWGWLLIRVWLLLNEHGIIIITQPQFPSLCKSFQIQFGHMRTHKHYSPEMLTLILQFRDLWIPVVCNLKLSSAVMPLCSVPALERQNDHYWYPQTNMNDHIQTLLSHLWSHQLLFHSQSSGIQE